MSDLSDLPQVILAYADTLELPMGVGSQHLKSDLGKYLLLILAQIAHS